MSDAPTFYLRAFGCQMNVYDAECLTELLISSGWSVAPQESADAAILLGCSVRASAENRLWGNITQLKRWKEERAGRVVALGGCTGEREAEKLLSRFPHLDVVFGTASLPRVEQLLFEARGGKRATHLGKDDFDAIGGFSAVCAFVTVMRGCDNHCAYCVVPGARGSERSRSVASIMEEVETRLLTGTKAITLVGQNVNSYSADGTDFADLLRSVAVSGVPRLRFTTSHPKDLSRRLVEAMAALDNVCPSLHLPVQSGADAVLLRMGRGYNRAEYLEKVDLVRSLVTGVGLTSDLMVGFSGETNDDFADTLSLVREVGYDAAFLFKYNVRAGTRAAEWDDDVAPDTKQQRLKELIAAQAEITRRINRSLEGRVEEVLVEGGARKGGLRGRTMRGQVVNWLGKAAIGEICRVRITSGDGHTLKGELVVGEGE